MPGKLEMDRVEDFRLWPGTLSLALPRVPEPVEGEGEGTEKGNRKRKRDEIDLMTPLILLTPSP